MENNVEKAKKFIMWSLVLSLFFHAGFLLIKFGDMNFLTDKPKPKEERIKIVLRDKPNNSKPKQIVTSELTKNKKRDPKAKFLSKQNQTFDKQMTAKTTGSFKAAGKGTKNGRKKAAKQQKAQAAEIATAAVKKPKESKRGRRKKKKISFADLAVGHKVVKAKPKKKRAAASLSALGLKNGNVKKSGLSANNDFVEDVPLGDMTRLNTVEYKYYGFYHRIKQKLEQYWGNTIQKKAMALWKSGRRLPAAENRITSLEITIDTKGNIVKINVQGSSGVKELDEAAIESFNRAGPFPNPPAGMMKNGIAKIKWGFVVKG